MKETQTPNWGRRLLEGYIILVAGAFLVSFLIWAIWAVNGWNSPLNPDRNYEALFTVMFIVFVFSPIMAYRHHRGAVDQLNIVTPVELTGLPRRKAQWHERCSRR